MGVALAVTLATSVLLVGSVLPWQRAVVHVGLAVACGVAMRLPSHSLHDSGRALRLARAGAVLVGAAAMGLLVLPLGLLRWVSPAGAAARAGLPWATVSLDPEATVSALALGSGALAVAVCAAAWSTGRHHRSSAERAMVLGMGTLGLVAGLHALAGAQTVFGVLAPLQPPAPFFAPLVNPNHLGTLLLLGLPVCVGQAVDQRAPDARYTAVAVSVVLGLLIVAIRAPGVWTAAAVVGVVAASGSNAPAGRKVALVLGALVAAAVALAVFAWITPRWTAESVTPRMWLYADQPRVFLGHWLFGTGAGAFGDAYLPFKSNPAFKRYEHAHSDPLEWVVTTGLVGLVAVALALWSLRGREGLEARRAWWWQLGLLGVAVHSFLDFPLQVPAVLFVVTAAFAVWQVGFAHHEAAPGPALRRWLGALLALQLLAAGWSVRTAIADRAAGRVLAFPTDRAGADRGAATLAWTAPWRPETRLHGAWSAYASGDRDGARERALDLMARYPADGGTQRRAGMLLAAVGHPDDARRAYERAIVRDPTDFRTWVALSKLDEPTDAFAAAESLAEAMRHWPWNQADNGRPLVHGYALLPVAVWWVDALADAPAMWSHWLGDLLVSRKEPVEALMAYEQACRIDPVYADSAARAIPMAWLGREREAEALVTGLIARFPSEPNHRYVAGQLLVRQGRYTEASERFLEAVTLDPDWPAPQVAAVTSAAEAAGPEAGLAVFRRLEIVAMVRPATRLEAARLEHQAGRESDCIRQIDDYDLEADDAAGATARTLRARCLESCTVCRDITQR